MFTSSFACTPSPASAAITSLAFMFDEVPEPVWKTSIGNWSSSSPFAIRSPAAAIRSALSGVEQPELGVHARGGGLDPAEPARDRRGDRLAGDREVGDRLARLAAPELLLPRGRHGSSAGALDRPRPCAAEQLVPARRASPAAGRAAPGGPLVRVDRLPARVLDEGHAAPDEQRLEVALAAAQSSPRAASSSSRSTVSVGVLLVRADHAARAALDPAGAVRRGRRRVDAAASFGIVPRPSSNGTPGSATPR